MAQEKRGLKKVLSKGNRLNVILILIFVVLGIIFAGRFPKFGDHYGIWSILPPAIAIVLAFWTQEVISSLFVGIVLGGIISGKLNIVQEFLIPSIGTQDFALILLVYLWALGGLIGIWNRTGGAMRFANWAGTKMAKGRRGTLFFTWIMGLIFHQGGTISTILTGATVKPIGDKEGVSHEELSYMVDSTASPAATIIPFNVWPIYVASLVVGTIPLFETNQDGIGFFIRSIPFNFYGILAVLVGLLFALQLLPWIPGKRMRAAIKRVKTTGKLDADDANPMTSEELSVAKVPEGYRTGLIDFFGPIGVLLGVAIIPYVVTFYIMGRTEDPVFLVAEAFVLAVLTGIFIALAKGMDLKVVMEGFVDGCKGVTIGALILALAVTLKEVSDAVGTAQYVIDLLGNIIVPTALPAILMILCLIIAFSTGTSWGTYAVVFPIAMPLAWAIYPDPTFISICFGAVIGGAALGDQCSPISDTTILSSLATGCDLMDHVKTQIPLAFSAGFIAMICSVISVMIFV